MSGPGLPVRFHHLGLAVRRPEKAVRFLSLLGYSIGDSVFDPLQGTHLLMCRGEGLPAVEVIWQGDDGGPLSGLLRERSELIYHVCLETPALAPLLAALREQGVRVTSVAPPLPAVLFDGRLVSFHMIQGFGLIEVLEGEAPESSPGREG